MGVGRFILPQMQVSNEWQRPSDWLPMPNNITATDQIFVGLHAVIENSDNYCAFSFITSAGQYRVDWGDGNVTLHNSGTIAQYQYNYAAISNSTLSSRGYKQVMIKVTPVSGNLISDNEKTNLSTAYDHSQSVGNPHNTTKADIGLGNVDNTSDLNKPISTATQNAYLTKVITVFNLPIS